MWLRNRLHNMRASEVQQCSTAHLLAISMLLTRRGRAGLSPLHRPLHPLPPRLPEKQCLLLWSTSCTKQGSTAWQLERTVNRRRGRWTARSPMYLTHSALCARGRHAPQSGLTLEEQEHAHGTCGHAPSAFSARLSAWKGRPLPLSRFTQAMASTSAMGRPLWPSRALAWLKTTAGARRCVQRGLRRRGGKHHT